MPPSYTYVTLEVIDTSIALIKYNRPQSGNSLHPQLLSEMLSAMLWAHAQPSIQIIIQSGIGKFFCTGMHLVDGSSPSMSFAPTSDFHSLNHLLITTPKLLIAAVNGPAAGYGASSLALFDLVYSVPDAYFFTPFVKWGMAAEGASSVTFPRLMGHQKAARMFLAGERLTAEEAERLGLVSEVLPREGFLSDVVQIARRIAQSPPGALRATKELMRGPVRRMLLEANDRECAIICKERLPSHEPQRAIAQFRVEQKRKHEGKSRL